MAGRKYELAAAYVRIMPSLDGVAGAIEKEISKALKEAAPKSEKTLKESLSKAVKTVDFSSVAKGLFAGSKAALAPLNAALSTSVKSAGRLFGDTLAVGARSAGAVLTGAVAAVGSQIAVGGFSRALGINQATAGLKAMGYQGEQFTAIMNAATNAVDGTAYSLDQSVLAARNFIASGVPEDKLQGYLENVGKLADMGTRSYGDIATILQKISASGRVMGDDMLQLADAGIPIYNALADAMGVTVSEVRDLGSAGKISFADLNRAIENVNWDSALFAATDVSSAFGNVRAQLSKTGANLWAPIIDGLPEILVNLRSFISTFNSTFDFNPLQTRLAASMGKINSIFDRFKGDDGKLDSNRVETYVESVIGDFGRLADKLEAYRGVIAGALIGIGGSFLSSIPVIGPAFAGLTPIVGAFAGVLITAYDQSEKLQETIKSLGGFGKNLWKDLSASASGFDPNDLFSSIGDGLASAIEWIKDLVSDFIKGLGDNLPAIQDSVNGLFKGIGDAFKSASDAGLDGAAIADIFTKIIQIFGTYAPLAFDVLLNAAAMVSKVIQSDWFTGFINFLTGTFSALAANEAVLQTGLAIAAGIFVRGKLLPIFKGIIGFMTSFNKAAPVMKAAGAGASAAAGGFKALLLGMGKILAIVTAVVAVMAAIGWLMQNTGFMDYVNVFISEFLGGVNVIAVGLATIIDTLLPTIESLLNVINIVIVNLIGGLISAIVEPLNNYIETIGFVITSIIDASARLTDALSGLALAGGSFLDSVGKLLTTLAINGQAAGEGAFAAAGGIAALMAAIAGGSAAGSGSKLLDGAVSFITGKEGSDPLAELMTIVDGISKLAAMASVFPQVFATALAQGMAFGLQLPASISQGILAGAPIIAAALSSAIASSLAVQQSYLDANPLIVRLKVDDSALKNIPTGAAGGNGNSYYRTNNYSLKSSNDSVIKSLLKGGRGY